MVIKNPSAYHLHTAQTDIPTLLLTQFLGELFEVGERCVSTGKHGGPGDGWARVLVAHRNT